MCFVTIAWTQSMIFAELRDVVSLNMNRNCLCNTVSQCI